MGYNARNDEIRDNVTRKKEGAMSFLGAKFQNCVATAILVSVVLSWSAEAAPPDYGYRPIAIPATVYIATKIYRNYANSGYTTCMVTNTNIRRDICVIYDVYPNFISVR